MDERLKGEGETRMQVRVRRECCSCKEPATRRVSYLLENARSNPRSSGYRKDNIAWCSDEESFACEEHVGTVERDAPPGMKWGSTFDIKKFQHMGLYWRVSEEVTP